MFDYLGPKRSRVYPALTEGDQVEIMRKKGFCEKERSSHWLRETFTEQRLKRDPDSFLFKCKMTDPHPY